MKSKRSVYILLPAVALIWGLIAQRIWSAANRDKQPNERITEIAKAVAPNPDRHPPPLSLSYQDPFKAQGALLVHQSNSSFPNQVSSARTAKNATLNLPAPPPAALAPAPVIWPDVKYLGTITNQRLGTRVVLMSVDNAEVMLKAGGSEKGLRIVKAFSDSVRIIFQGRQRTFSRAAADMK